MSLQILVSLLAVRLVRRDDAVAHRQLARGALEDAGELYIGAGIRRRLDEVACKDEVDAGKRAQMPDRELGITVRRGDGGADRGGAEIDLAQQRAGLGDSIDLLAHGGAPTAEFGAE